MDLWGRVVKESRVKNKKEIHDGCFLCVNKNNTNKTFQENYHITDYRNNPKYLDRYAFANSVNTDQTLENEMSDQGLHCYTYSNLLDISR